LKKNLVQKIHLKFLINVPTIELTFVGNIFSNIFEREEKKRTIKGGGKT
jgi:hypothetical protein